MGETLTGVAPHLFAVGVLWRPSVDHMIRSWLRHQLGNSFVDVTIKQLRGLKMKRPR